MDLTDEGWIPQASSILAGYKILSAGPNNLLPRSGMKDLFLSILLLPSLSFLTKEGSN